MLSTLLTHIPRLLLTWQSLQFSTCATPVNMLSQPLGAIAHHFGSEMLNSLLVLEPWIPCMLHLMIFMLPMQWHLSTQTKRMPFMVKRLYMGLHISPFCVPSKQFSTEFSTFTSIMLTQLPPCMHITKDTNGTLCTPLTSVMPFSALPVPFITLQTYILMMSPPEASTLVVLWHYSVPILIPTSFI